MVLKDIQNIFHKELDAIYGKEEVDSFFYLLIDDYLGLNRLFLTLQPEFSLTKEEESPLFEALSELKLEKPIQYILGKTEFFGLNFKVNEYTLIPRPETEELVAWILDAVSSKSQPLKILDIGTGSGCIAISLAENLPNAKVYALDVSDGALNVANENARLNDVDIKFLKANILDRKSWNLIFEDLKFDIIVSNPPYVRHLEKAEIKNNVLKYEPELALFVENEDPLIFYKSIAEFASQRLQDGGHLYFEINKYLGEDMIEMLQDFPLKNIELKTDLSGNDRMVKAIK